VYGILVCVLCRSLFEICVLRGCLLQVDGGWFGRGALSRSHDGWPARACVYRLVVLCVCLFQMSGL